METVRTKETKVTKVTIAQAIVEMARAIDGMAVAIVQVARAIKKAGR
jgi:hypothetical protein